MLTKGQGVRRCVLLVALAAALSASAGNLVVDAEFSPNGLGGLLNWTCGWHGVFERTVVRLPKAGPHHSDAVLLKDASRSDGLTQNGYVLAVGEPYRISVWTRTKGLPEEGVRWVLWGEGWKGPDCSVFFPTNTNGQWVQIEATCEAIPVATCGLHVRFNADMPAGATLELARPVLEPLSEKGQKESRSPAAKARRDHFRIVPIAPKLSEVDPDSGEMTFYYGGDLPGEFGEFELRAAVDGVSRGSAPLDDTRRVTIRMGRILPGDHSLALNLIRRKTNRRISRDVYQIRARKPVVFDVGKPLNNLVTELVSTKAAAGDFPFVNPRDGWVFMGLSDAGETAEGFLDGDETPVIRPREGEPLATMRYLLAGRHVLTLRGVSGGALAIRAVKTIAFSCQWNQLRETDIRQHRYGMSFCRRFVYPWFNFGRVKCYGAQDRYHSSEDEAPLANAERGIRMVGTASLSVADERRGDVNEIIGAIRKEFSGWNSGRDIFFDENLVRGPHDWHENFAEALWRTYAAGQAVYTYYGEGGCPPFSEPRVHANEISAIVNSGTGRGCLALEAYPRGYSDKTRAYAQVDEYLAFAKSIEAIMPAAKNSVDYHFGYWMQPGSYCTWVSAAADMRVLTEHMFRRVAADPAFRDTAWGVGFGSFYTTDEEMARWMMRLVRHYAIEGRTDSISDSLGYRYNPGYIRNGDLESGMDGWTVEAAAPDSLKRIVIDGYGRKEQGRRREAGDVDGDAIALFVRQPDRANRLSQKISGLVPGRRYSLVYISQNYDQYLKTPGAQGTNYAFRVDFDGATNEPALESCGIGGKRPVCRHRLVFRAQSPEVTVTFLDRAPGEPECVTTRIGQRRMVNFFHVHDYFEGERQDVDDMLKLNEDGAGTPEGGR